jgi:tetratricopeptide (TPR) repeat protein
VSDGANQLREQVRTAWLSLADLSAELGTVLGLLGEHGQAESLLRLAVAVYESNGGLDFPRLAAPLSSLGAARQARGHLDEAAALYRRALEVNNTRALERP